MMDFARNWINNNSSVVTVAATIILVGAIAYMVSSGVNPPPDAGLAWYYDTVSGEHFTDAATRIAPFVRDNGNEAVRAHFFTCGQCTAKLIDEGGERFIGYYEKYTDEVKQKLQTAPDNFIMYDMAMSMGRLYSKDGNAWFAAEKPDGVSITSELQRRCPPKKLRYCPPK